MCGLREREAESRRCGVASCARRGWSGQCERSRSERRGRTLETRNVPRPLMAFMRSKTLTLVFCESVSEIAEACRHSVERAGERRAWSARVRRATSDGDEQRTLLITMSIPPNLDAVSSMACVAGSVLGMHAARRAGSESARLFDLSLLTNVDDEGQCRASRLFDGLGCGVDGPRELWVRLGAARGRWSAGCDGAEEGGGGGEGARLCCDGDFCAGLLCELESDGETDAA